MAYYSVVYACMYNFLSDQIFTLVAFVYFCLNSIMSNKQTNKNLLGAPDLQLIFNQLFFFKMASRNKLLPVWGSHLGNTCATETRAGVYT